MRLSAPVENGVESPADYQTSNKNAMQRLYREQLDSLVQFKEEQKAQDRLRLQQDRKEFNRNAQIGQEAERMKDLSYKNYYAMLMDSQQIYQQAYVSPYSKRDGAKETHIATGVEQERKRYDHFEVQMRKRDSERKVNYKNELLAQIDDRKRRENANKCQDQREKESLLRFAKSPEQIQKYEKERRLQEMDKYREELDSQRPSRQSRNVMSQVVLRPSEVHNTLTNPMPYNIQNPYLLRQMASHQQKDSRVAPTHSNPADSKYTPADNKYTPADNKYTPADSKYTPADNKYTPADNKYTPADNKYTPADNKYTPQRRGGN